MWKRKWLVIGILLPILIVGSISGAVLAQTEDGGEIQPEDRYQALLDRVCAIYEENTGVALDPEQLEGALDQARREMRDEALEGKLQGLVDEGMISQEEADQYLEWWQDRPDIELPGPKGRGFRGDMMGGRGFHGRDGGPFCAPDASDEA